MWISWKNLNGDNKQTGKRSVVEPNKILFCQRRKYPCLRNGLEPPHFPRVLQQVSNDVNQSITTLTLRPEVFPSQWRPCRSTSLRFLRSAPVVPLPRPPLHWFPSAGGRSLAAKYPATVGELSRGPSSEQWFSRPCRELRPPMLRKWRGFPLKNRSFSPWVVTCLFHIQFVNHFEAN